MPADSYLDGLQLLHYIKAPLKKNVFPQLSSIYSKYNIMLLYCAFISEMLL